MDVAELANRVDALDIGTLELADVRTALDDVAAIGRWHDRTRLVLHARLEALAETSPSIFPEQISATASGRTAREAERDTTRVEILDTSTPIHDAFRAGTISVDHLDVLAHAGRQLPPEQRATLLDDPALAVIATAGSPEDLAKAVRARIHRLQLNDGTDRLAQQRRNINLRHWIDKVTGMVCYRGELDPDNGRKLLARLATKVDELFHDTLPDTCPTDHEAKQAHLRGLALLALTDAKHAHPGVVETIVVIDADTLESGWHEHSITEHQHDSIDIPLSTIRTQMCTGHITPVITSNGAVLDAGRTQRLATPLQRRALRAMYPTCAIPHCHVRFDHCEPHHILWWRHLGNTDLDNLLPLCSKHHHLVHDTDWHIALHPRTRELTITLPDGTIITGGRPSSGVDLCDLVVPAVAGDLGIALDKPDRDPRT